MAQVKTAKAKLTEAERILERAALDQCRRDVASDVRRRWSDGTFKTSQSSLGDTIVDLHIRRDSGHQAVVTRTVPKWMVLDPEKNARELRLEGTKIGQSVSVIVNSTEANLEYDREAFVEVVGPPVDYFPRPQAREESRASNEPEWEEEDPDTFPMWGPYPE